LTCKKKKISLFAKDEHWACT